MQAAEGEQEAAQRRANAISTQAEAQWDARTLEAEGEQAIQVVPVNVQREQVRVDAERQTQVEAQRVAVLRQELEAKAQHQEVSVALQNALVSIEAQKEGGVALAQAVGEMFSAGDMKLFGTPDLLMDALKKYAQGLGLGYWIEGSTAATPDSVKEGVVDMASSLGAAVAGWTGHKSGLTEPEANASAEQ